MSHHNPISTSNHRPKDIHTTSPSPKGKGKQREESSSPDISLSSQLQEALETPLSPTLSSSIDSNFEAVSPISPPPKAIRAPSRSSLNNPRLVSQLTRATLPVSSLSYASGGLNRVRSNSHTGLPQLGESSTAWRKSLTIDDPFPDLDPSTGLPLESPPRTSIDSTAPSLHLQRTITGLLGTEKEGTSIFPTLSSLGGVMPNLGLKRSSSVRNLSTSAPSGDWTSWATGWWGGNKGKVDRMMSEEDQAETVDEEKDKLRQKYKTPRNPIVFCHGLLGFDYLGPASLPPLQISHWRGIREVLESNGVEVLIARVPATASIKDRAEILDELIGEKFPGREVNLIGHSMGGLDCRYLISEIRPKKFKVISLTTISTPHRGSPFADYLIDNVIGRDRLPSLLTILESFRLPQSGDGSAFSALSTRSMKQFNAEVVDDPDVSYYSWGASFDPGLLDTFRWPHSVILSKEGPNDGLVSVHSARWGEYRGTLLGVNHLDLVGWVNHVRYAISGWTGNPIQFKPATFYLEVSDYLAEMGF